MRQFPHDKYVLHTSLQNLILTKCERNAFHQPPPAPKSNVVKLEFSEQLKLVKLRNQNENLPKEASNLYSHTTPTHHPDRASLILEHDWVPSCF